MIERLDFAPADPAYPPSYRTNDRWVADDPALAAELFALLGALPAEQIDAAGDRWRLSRLNPRMRACRYRPGQWFGIHRDGVCHISARERSFLSVLVYLDEGFGGGETRFFADRDGRTVTRTIAPSTGTTAVFDHALWHDGAPVSAGIKHVLRTDVMYTRVEAHDREGHLGYVWSLAAAGALLASGGRDKTIKLWREGRCISSTRAHDASVTCLAVIDATTLVSGSRDRSVKTWRITGEELELVSTATPHDGAVLAVMALRNEIVSAGADGVVATAGGARERRHQGWIWGLAELDGSIVSVGEDGLLVIGSRVIDLGVPLLCVARTDDGLVIGARDGRIFVVSRSGEVLRWFRAHAAAVTCVTARPNGEIASGGEDDAVRVWSRHGALIGEEAHRDFVRAVCSLPDGRLASAGYDSTIAHGG